MNAPEQVEGRQLTVKELAFFTVPRAWPEIMARFGAVHAEIRDGIILADSDGGFGFLVWRDAGKAWVLTEKGRAWVTAMGSAKLLKDAGKWVPPAEPYPVRVGNKPGPKPKVKPDSAESGPTAAQLEILSAPFVESITTAAILEAEALLAAVEIPRHETLLIPVSPAVLEQLLDDEPVTPPARRSCPVDIFGDDE